MTAALSPNFSDVSWRAHRPRACMRDSSLQSPMRQRMIAVGVVTFTHLATAMALLHQPAETPWKVPMAVHVSLVSSPVEEHVPAPEPTPKPVARKPEPIKHETLPEPMPDQMVAETVIVESPPAPIPAVAETEPYVEPLYDAAYLKNDPPAYPLSARRRGVQGTVMVRAEIGTDGRCHHAVVKTSSGHVMLDEVAIKAVRGWRFLPAKRGIKPTAAWVEIPIVFKLTG